MQRVVASPSAAVYCSAKGRSRMQRVEKTGGSNPAEVVYFNGQPIALLNPSSNSWTDLIWAGSSLIAEVPGSQRATSVYRLLDHEGSLAATVNSAGGILATNLFTPYGQLMNSGAGWPAPIFRIQIIPS